MLAVFLAGAFVTIRHKPSGGLAGKGTITAVPVAHVDWLTLGIDWRGRREVQAALASLAKNAAFDTPETLRDALRAVALALVSARPYWLYAALVPSRRGPLRRRL